MAQTQPSRPDDLYFIQGTLDLIGRKVSSLEERKEMIQSRIDWVRHHDPDEESNVGCQLASELLLQRQQIEEQILETEFLAEGIRRTLS